MIVKYSESVVAKLATPKHIALFSESNQRVAHSEYAENIHRYLLGKSDSPYIENSPMCYYSVDLLLGQLQSEGFVISDVRGKEVLAISPISHDWGLALVNAELTKGDHSALIDFSNKYDAKCLIVNDFSTPELKPFLKQFDRYILIKPFGDYPSISPVMGADASCYQCFYDRLLHNQPIRKWWLGNKGEEVSVPAAVLPDQKIESFIASLNAPEKNVLNIYSSKYQYISSHNLIPNSECLVCGNLDIFSEQLENPIRLNKIKKNNYRDGGFRTEDPDVTLHKLEGLVDPVLGYITDVYAKEQVSIDKNIIYFSSFYTQPYRKYDFKPERFIYSTMGKGISHRQSQISALSEAVERIASQYHGNEPKIFSKASELEGRYVSVEDLTSFSDNQYNVFESALQSENLNQIHQCEPYADDPIHWTHGWSLLSGDKIYLPFNFCYANTPFEDRFTNFFHNGGSAGNCLEEAVLQGMFELIERDAVAIWWYNRLECPRVDYSCVSEKLLKQIEQQLLPEYDVWVLDLTQDIQVPVMCAVTHHKVTGEFALGFGCHLDGVISCQRALTEVFQLIEIKDSNTSPFHLSQIQAEPYIFGQIETCKALEQSKIISDDIKDDIDFCLAEIEQLGLDVIAINNSRAALKLSSVKVIIPGLCHIFPYFGLRRLYDVPVQLGYFDQPKQEAELNPLELLI